MLSDIKLSCSASAWGKNGFVEAISAISDAGYEGVECSALLVNEYEDRLHVFEEIFEISNIKLVSMLQIPDILNRETAEEEVERIANTARFLLANESQCVVVSPSNKEPEEPLDDDQWTTVAAIIEEMGARCNEFDMQMCFRPRCGFLAGDEKSFTRLLGMVDPNLVKICVDTAEFELAGISIDKFCKTYADRIGYLRLRDVSSSKKRLPTTSNVPGSAPQFGRGCIDFEKITAIIEKIDYSGALTIDVAGESHKPKLAAEDAYRFIVKKSGLFF
jgi:inosose dehydratase